MTYVKMSEITNILLYVFNAALIGTIAWTWIVIILDVENLAFIYDWFESWLDKGKIGKLLFKVGFRCFYCFAGQTSLWFYLVFYGLSDYNPFYHIGFVMLSILTTQIIKRKYG